MRIRLLFFAMYRDLAGADGIDLDVPHGATAADVVAQLRAGGNGLTRLPPRPALAVNRTYASLETVLRDGDELALLPPVAGG